MKTLQPTIAGRRHFLRMAGTAPFLWHGARAWAAADYPAMPIKIVVPFSASSGADLSMRRLSPALGEVLGQAIVIDNKAGAGGIIGSEFVARSAPDGYTLLAGTMSTHAINVGVYKKLPYDPVKSFVPISRTNAFTNVLVVPSSLGVSSMAGLLAYARRSKRPLTAATGGAGTTPHLAAEMLRMATKMDILSVPYKATGAYVPDVMAGTVDMTFANIPSVLGQVRAGRLVALAVTSHTRSPLLPAVPTMSEAGVDGVILSIWIALFAPLGTPAEIVQKLSAATRKALDTPAVGQGLVNDGSQVETDATPAAFAGFLEGEVSRWVGVTRAAGIVPE